MRSKPYNPRTTSRPHPSAGHLRRAVGADHNILCRRVDRSLSRLWLAVPLSLLLAGAVAAAVALLSLRAMDADARAWEAGHHQVRAAVLSAAEQTDPSSVGADITYQAQAAWTYPAGHAVTGPVPVPENAGPGSTAVIWVTGDGRLATAPGTETSRRSDAAAAGLGTMAALTLIVSAGYVLRRRALDRRAAYSWQDEWSKVEPTWSGRTRGTPDGPFA